MNLCPAFRQIGKGQRAFLVSTTHSLQLEIFSVPKWHILGWHILLPINIYFWRGVDVQLLSCVSLFARPLTAACQASLSFTISWSLPLIFSLSSAFIHYSLNQHSIQKLDHLGAFKILGGVLSKC